MEKKALFVADLLGGNQTRPASERRQFGAFCERQDAALVNFRPLASAGGLFSFGKATAHGVGAAGCVVPHRQAGRQPQLAFGGTLKSYCRISSGPSCYCRSQKVKGPRRNQGPLVVEIIGIEPTTSSLRTKRSPG